VVGAAPGAGRFSVCGFRRGRLVAVESVNKPADHIAAWRLLAAGQSPEPGQVADSAFSLKSFATEPV
jgi:3-phenylpropionate/trans-cinnamate dioxygenase ferredoxin reductase component